MRFTLLTLLAISCASLVLSASSEAIKAQESVPFDDPYAIRKLFYEKYWQRKIESALRFVEGAVVNVEVELSREIDRTVKSMEIIGEPVAETEAAISSSSTTNGRSGLESQGPGRGGDGRGRKSETKDESQITSCIPTAESTASLAGLVPEKVAVSVAIPSSYYEQLQILRKSKAASSDRSDNATLAELENEVESKVKQTISVLLPKGHDETTFSDVVVTSFEVLASPAAQQETQAYREGDVITVTIDRRNFLPRSDVAEARDEPIQKIAAEIVEVKRNGRLVIEGKQHVLKNGTHCQVAVSGVIHASSILPDASVPSTKIGDFKWMSFKTGD